MPLTIAPTSTSAPVEFRGGWDTDGNLFVALLGVKHHVVHMIRMLVTQSKLHLRYSSQISCLDVQSFSQSRVVQTHMALLGGAYKTCFSRVGPDQLLPATGQASTEQIDKLGAAQRRIEQHTAVTLPEHPRCTSGNRRIDADHAAQQSAFSGQRHWKFRWQCPWIKGFLRSISPVSAGQQPVEQFPFEVGHATRYAHTLSRTPAHAHLRWLTAQGLAVW